MIGAFQMRLSIMGSLCFSVLICTGSIAAASGLNEAIRLRQSYNQSAPEAIAYGKKIRISQLMGLARYRYLRGLRSNACLKQSYCPTAYLQKVNGNNLIKLVSPRRKSIEVSVYNFDGSISLGTCKTQANIACQLN